MLVSLSIPNINNMQGLGFRARDPLNGVLQMGLSGSVTFPLILSLPVELPLPGTARLR